MNLFVKVIRYKKSYSYKKSKYLPDDWHNNDDNNMLDDFMLYLDEACLFRAKVQTVANIPGGRFTDTIAPGPFKLKLFVEPRNFYGRIHGLTGCYDLDGQYIDEKSVQPKRGSNGAPADFARWLVHDTQSLKPKPPMAVTRVAWSAGCFVMSPSNLAGLGAVFDSFGLKPLDTIKGELSEQD